MHRYLLASVFAVAFATSTSAQTLTEPAVSAAIARAGKFKPLILTEAFNMAASGYRIEVYSPAAWVSQLAQQAKREMRPFSEADVPEEVRANVWRVKAWPSMPRKVNETGLASSVDHVVARTPDKSIVVQPTSKEPFEDRVQNAFGAGYTLSGLLLTFPGEQIAELWGPNQDREFVFSVIGPSWKYDFTIKSKHFKQLQ